MAINARLSAPTNYGGSKHIYRRSVVALLLALVFTLSGCQVFAQTPLSDRLSAIQVYHQGWQLVNDEYVDTNKLAAVHWNSLEHAHDAQIETLEDAGKYLQQELNKLGDIYTRYLTPQDMKDLTEQIVGEVGGLGVELALAVNNEHREYCRC